MKLTARDYGFMLLVLGMMSWIAWLAVGNMRTAGAMTERYEVARRLAQRLSQPNGWPADCRQRESFDDCLVQLRPVLAELETAPSAQPGLFDRCDRQLPISFGAVIIDVVRPDAPDANLERVIAAQPVLASGTHLRVGVCGPGFQVLLVAEVAAP